MDQFLKLTIELARRVKEYCLSFIHKADVDVSVINLNEEITLFKDSFEFGAFKDDLIEFSNFMII